MPALQQTHAVGSTPYTTSLGHVIYLEPRAKNTLCARCEDQGQDPLQDDKNDHHDIPKVPNCTHRLVLVLVVLIVRDNCLVVLDPAGEPGLDPLQLPVPVVET